MENSYTFTNDDVNNAVNAELYKLEDPLSNKHAIMIVGQPAAGKSSITRQYLTSHINIDADDYRVYHPAYKQIQTEQGKDAAKYTGEFAGKVCEKLIDIAAQNKINIIVQGTGRNYDTVKNTAMLLKRNGYNIDLKVIACPVKLSTMSIYRRYYKMQQITNNARFSDLSHSKTVIENLPQNLDKLRNDKIFNSIEIINRDNKVLWNNQSQQKPSDVLKTEFIRPLTPAEKGAFQAARELITNVTQDTQVYSNIIKEVNAFSNKIEKSIKNKGYSR